MRNIVPPNGARLRSPPFRFLGKVFSTYLASLCTPKEGGAKWALLKKDISEDLFLLANLTHLYDALHLHSQVLKASLLTFPFISTNLLDGHPYALDNLLMFLMRWILFTSEQK